jgi:hypothetical protein
MPDWLTVVAWISLGLAVDYRLQIADFEYIGELNHATKFAAD